MKTSEVLRKAGDMLRERGWFQGWFVSDDGAVCLAGACNRAFAEPVKTTPSEIFLPIETVLDGMPVAVWNDDPQRRLEEVLEAVDAAYVLALQEEGVEPEDVL